MISLIWKEWRQHRLIFFMSLGLIFLVRVLLLLLWVREAGDLLVDVRVVLAFLFALFLGVASFTNEFHKETLDFLNCQPVSAAKIYWTKFLFGLVLLSCLVLCAVVIFPIPTPHNIDGFMRSIMYGRVFVLLLCCVYSAAFFASLSLRSSLVAVIATPVIMAIGLLLVFTNMIMVFVCEPVEPLAKGQPLLVSLVLSSLTIVLCIVCWWRALPRLKNTGYGTHLIASTLLVTVFVGVTGFFLALVSWWLIPGEKYGFLLKPTTVLVASLSFILIVLGFVFWRRLISRSKPQAKVICIAVVACLLSVLMTHSLANFIGDRHLAEVKAVAREAGLPFTIEEIIPPKVADSDNAALICIEAFAMYRKLERKYEGRGIPRGYRPFEEWDLIPFVGRVEYERLTPAQKERVVELVLGDPEFAEVYALLDKAVEMPSCRFEIKYEGTPWRRNEYSYELTRAANLIAARTFLLAEQGKYDEAVESARVGFRIGNALENEPIDNSQYDRRRCDDIAMDSLRTMVSDVPPEAMPVDAYSKLIAEIRSKDYRLGVRKALEGKFAVSMSLCEKVSQGDREAYGIFLDDYGRFPRILQVILSSHIYRPLLKANVAAYLHWLRVITEFSSRPYYETRQERAEIWRQFPYGYSSILMRFLPRHALGMQSNHARFSVRLNGFQLTLALKAYKAEKGEYPNSLDVLVPDILPELPLDLFTGKNYSYRREGEGYIVYSQGENQTDDGGNRRRWEHGKWLGEGDDIAAWRALK